MNEGFRVLLRKIMLAHQTRGEWQEGSKEVCQIICTNVCQIIRQATPIAAHRGYFAMWQATTSALVGASAMVPTRTSALKCLLPESGKLQWLCS